MNDVYTYREGSFGGFIDSEVAGTSKASGGALGGGSESLAVYPINTMVAQGRPSDDGRMGLGLGSDSDPSPTVTAKHHHAVAYSVNGDVTPKTGNEISSTLRANAGGIGGAGQAVAYSVIGDTTPKVGEEICGTLRSQGGGGIVPPSVANAGNVINKPPTGGGNGVGFSDEDISYTLTAGDNHAVAYGVDTKQNQPTENKEVSATLVASGYKEPVGVIQQSIVRRLTPLECERLQGFPDEYTKVPYRGKPADDCPDSPRYKALGNSMAVTVMHYIGERIQIALLTEAEIIKRGIQL